MAENESIDIGSSPRMRVVIKAFRNGTSCPEITTKFERVFVGELRKGLKQIGEKDVSLTDLLKSRDCPEALEKLRRKTHGNPLVELFVESARHCGPTEAECVKGFVDAVENKLTDQISHQIVGSEHYPTIEDVQFATNEMREKFTPAKEKLVSGFIGDPNCLPRLPRGKALSAAASTAELMDLSLLGAPS